MGICRRVKQSIAEDEEGEELDGADEGNDNGSKKEGGGDKDGGEDKEEGEGSPVYWSQPASAVVALNKNDDSDEDVERYFAE